MAALVTCDCRGNVQDSQTFPAQSLAEIHILEPDGIKAFVEAADQFPGGPADQQESAGRLIHFNGLGVRYLGTVTAVHPVPRQQPVEPKSFKTQRPGRWESSDVKTRL